MNKIICGVIICFLTVNLLFSCKRDCLYDWDSVNDITENIIFSHIEQENIDFTSVTMWGTTDYGKYLDVIHIGIFFIKGNWDNFLVYNEIIKNDISNNIYSTFTNLNNNNVLKTEKIEITAFYPFKIMSPNEIKLSEDEEEELDDLLWDEFEMQHVLEITENYCEGWIDEKYDLDKFINFMKIQFGSDIVIEM